MGTYSGRAEWRGGDLKTIQHSLETLYQTLSMQALLLLCSFIFFLSSEPGIHHGNEDSRVMKIENRRNIIFCGEKIDKHTFFPMKIKMMDL